MTQSHVNPPRARDRAALRRDATTLGALVRALPAMSRADAGPDGAVDAGDWSVVAEQHLCAVSALLIVLDTSLRAHRTSAVGPAAPAVTVSPARGVDVDLAAAAATYIARDLAARRLSEFTSAEGYRLARRLADIGRVRADVERLLADADTVHLHPMPLTGAVSHSAR